MRWSIIRTIWFREVRDQLRDRRTVLMLIVLPLLLYPLLGIAMARMSQLFQGQPLTIGVAGYELLLQDPFFPRFLDEDGKHFVSVLFQDQEDRDQLKVKFGPTAELEEALKRGDLHAVIVVTPEFLEGIRSGKQMAIDVRLKDGGGLETGQPLASGRPSPPLISSDDDRSRLAYLRLRPVIREWEGEIAKKRMLELNKPVDYARPLIVPLLKPKTEKLWSKIFPFLIVMMSLTGALYPAIDVCAGEKERGTMETLLISPASRAEIVLGKFLTVWVFSAAMALLNLASMGLTALVFSQMMSSASAVTGGTGVLPAPGLAAMLWCIVLLVPLGAFFSAVCLALAVYARSSKEGQYYLMPLMVATMFLTVFSVLPGVELTPLLSMLPVTGATLLLQSLMTAKAVDELPWLYLAPVLVPLAAYCYLALHWAIVQFNREEVLFREAERLDLGLWVRRLFREKELLPTPAMALVCFFVVLLLRWGISASGGQTNIIKLTAVLQVAFIASPAVLMATLLTSSPRLTLRLRWPRFALGSGLLGSFTRLGQSKLGGFLLWVMGAILLAVALHAPQLALVTAIIRQFPGLEERLNELGEQAKRLFGSGIPLYSQILVFAGLAAICEELAFRGFILSGLARRLGVGYGILVSSILFAFAHMAAFQFVPTFVLGLILSVLATRSGSLLPGMVFHFTHNALLVLAANLKMNPDETWSPIFTDEGFYSIPSVILACVVALALLTVLVRLPARPLTDEPEPDAPDPGE